MPTRGVGGALGGQLAALETAGLIQLAQAAPELEYLFRHALIQDAAYASLLRNSRRELHLSVGDVLERMKAGDPAEAAPLLAFHFYQAGDDARALRYLTLAGDEAARKYANGEAVLHYTRAIEVAARAQGANASGGEALRHLFAQRGRALELSSHYKEALSSYEEMAALAVQRGERALELAALLSRATIYSLPTPAHDPAQGHALNAQTILMARELNDRAAEAKAYWNLMVLGIFSGDEPEQTVAYGEQSLALARELNLREQAAYTLTDLYMAYFNVGDVARAQAVLVESRELWQSLGNLPMLADSLALTVHSLLAGGEYEQALAAIAEVTRVSRAAQAPWQEANGRQMEAFINFDRGDAGAAIKTTREIVDIADRIGLLPVQTGSRADLGLLYAQLGQIDRGRALALQAYHYAEQMAPLRAWTQAALARIELCAGRLPEAEQYSELAYPGYALLLKGLSVLVPAWAEIALARAEVQLERGRYVEAIATMDELAGALNAHGVRPFVCEAHYLKGRAQLALERWTEAAQSLAAAHADAEALGSRKVLWRTLMAERRLVLRRDDPAGAEKLREAAREIILALAACVPEDALRASFLALPDVRESARPA